MTTQTLTLHSIEIQNKYLCYGYVYSQSHLLGRVNVSWSQTQGRISDEINAFTPPKQKTKHFILVFTKHSTNGGISFKGVGRT